MSKPQVLIICTGNSMRSQLGEALLRHELGDKIDVYSAGTHPGYVHPLTLKSLANAGINTLGLRSKSTDEFLDKPIDLAITVCDAARERCPVFPYAKKTIHKGYPDPVSRAAAGDAQEKMDDLRELMRAELRALVLRELKLSD